MRWDLRSISSNVKDPTGRFVLVVMVACILGLPLGSFFHFLVFCLSVIGILHSLPNRFDGKRIYCFLLGVSAIVGFIALPSLRIQEGHNVFLKTAEKDPFAGVIPWPIYEFMDQRFKAAYPEDQQCEAGVLWCWKTAGIPTQAYAFSSDAFWDRGATLSRRVDGIHFATLSDLRTGFINDYNLCFYDEVSDVKRDALPYFATWIINKGMAGGALRWTGDLWIGNQIKGYTYMPGNGRCLLIDSNRVDDEIWVADIAPSDKLKVNFTPSLKVQSVIVLREILKLLAVLLLTLSFRRIEIRGFLRDLQVLAASLVVLGGMQLDFLFGRPALWGGGDGLWTEGFGFWSTQALYRGDFMEFWRSGENAYYLMPFLRYFRTLEDIFFGDTQHLMVGFTIIIPVLINRLLRLRFSESVSFVGTIVFCILPWHWGMIRWAELAIFGLSEPVALVFVLFPLVCLFSEDCSRHSFWNAISLAIAVGLRPNYLPVCVCIWSMFWLEHWQNQIGKGLNHLLIFAGIILLIPLHNLVFSHRWVMFTTGYTQVKTLMWIDWPLAVFQLFQLDWHGGSLQNVIHQLYAWIFTWPRLYWKIPEDPVLKTANGVINLLAISGCAGVLLPRYRDSLWRRIAFLALVAQSVVLLFEPTGRYSFLAWDLTYFAIIGAGLSALKNPSGIVSNLPVNRSLLLGILAVAFGILVGGVIHAHVSTLCKRRTVEIDFRMDHSSTADLFYGDEKGFHPKRRVSLQIFAHAQERLKFEISEPFARLRLDPSSEKNGSFSIESVRIKEGFSFWKNWPLDQLTLRHHIIRSDDQVNSFEITGDDPFMYLGYAPNKSAFDVLLNSRWAWMVFGGVFGAGLFFLNRRIVFSS